MNPDYQSAPAAAPAGYQANPNYQPATAAPAGYQTNPAYQRPAPAAPGKGMAIAAMVLGIVGVVFVTTIFISLICGIVGLVLGIVARKKNPAAKGMAIAGIVTGAVAVGLSLLFLILFGVILSGAFFGAMGTPYYEYTEYSDIWEMAAAMKHLF